MWYNKKGDDFMLEDMTNRIVYLEKGEMVVDENGEVLYESK